MKNGRSIKSLNIKSSSKKVSLQLLSELRRVCDGVQIFRQVIPRRRTGMAKWTFANLRAQPWQNSRIKNCFVQHAIEDGMCTEQREEGIWSATDLNWNVFTQILQQWRLEEHSATCLSTAKTDKTDYIISCRAHDNKDTANNVTETKTAESQPSWMWSVPKVNHFQGSM